MRYRVLVRNSSGGVDTLTVDAVSEQQAIQRAEAQGKVALVARAVGGALFKSSRSRSSFRLVQFSQELLALLAAGLSLREGLGVIMEKESRPGNKQVLQKINSYVHEGKSFSAALEQMPDVFPTLFVASVRASERTGDIANALQRYVAYQSQIEVLKKKLVSAAIYPVILIVVGLLVCLFLLGYVVPRFATIYETRMDHLPLMSKILLSWGKVIDSHGALVLVIVGMLILSVAYACTKPKVTQALLFRLWSVPVLGVQLKVYQLARFYRTLGMLLEGGIPILTALDMVIGVLPVSLQEQLSRAKGDIRDGKSISEAMAAHRLTTPVSHQMLSVGEQTGNMGQMMERIASFYDEDVARWLDWATKVFEPALMIFIGLVVGIVVVLMYLPIFELAGALE